MQIGQKIIRLTSVDSTNNYAAKLQKEGIINSGTVILAEEQFGGRGQRGSEWLSNAGENLTFSFFLSEVNLSVERQFKITQFVSVVLIELFRKKGIDCQIKWPNDIYHQTEKIAGILIESSIKGSSINSLIIGVGLNVNQNEFGSLKATSVSKIKGAYSNLDSILMEFIHEFNLQDLNQYLALEDEKKYLKNLYGLNEELLFEDENGSFKGVIHGIGGTGKIIIGQKGKTRSYAMKEIKFMR